MVELTPKYHINNIVHSDLYSINDDDLILWVLHADKIPPHIGISDQGRFYSLKSNGKDFGVSVCSIKSIIAKKEITSLCFTLKKSALKKSLEASFQVYENTIPYKITCLKPIKDVLGFNEPEKLIELLEVLHEEMLIDSVKGVYSNSFEGIVDYDLEDIHHRLVKLNHGK